MIRTQKPVPDPRIAAYIAELEQPGIPYVSTSHVTLSALYREHGANTIIDLLQEYFTAERQWRLSLHGLGAALTAAAASPSPPPSP